MKKILLVIFSFFILCKTVNASYIVYDMDNNRVLKEINMNEKHLVASTSKIMTAIVAIENSNLDSNVIVTKDILSAVGSSIYLEIGEKISMKDLLYGMMLRSGNDAATMIAIHVSGSMEKFTEKMNEYAKKIGINNTLFYNSHGLENKNGLGNTSTAYDMAVLTTYAMQNDKFRKIFSTKNYNCKSDRKNYSWQNKNKLLKYDYVTGGKTGYTKKAKRTLVTTGLINGTNIVVVTLNDSNDWETHKASYKYVKKNYQNERILNKNKFSLDTKNLFIEDTLYIKNNFNLLVTNSEKKLIKIKYFIKKESNYDNDDIVGYASIYLGNKEIGNEDIYIKKGKRKNKIKNFFQKLFKKDVD